MIEQLLQFTHAVVLWVLFWASAAALVAGHEAKTWRSLVLSVGLAGMVAMTFVGGVVMTFQPIPLPWWLAPLHTAIAAVALALYEYRFGIRRHITMVLAWLSTRRHRHPEHTA